MREMTDRIGLRSIKKMIDKSEEGITSPFLTWTRDSRTRGLRANGTKTYVKEIIRCLYLNLELSALLLKYPLAVWMYNGPTYWYARASGEIAELRILFKSWCHGFPSLIQLNSQLLHTFTSIDRMSQCPTDRNTLSLPLFTLQQLLARISPAITAFKPDVLAVSTPRLLAVLGMRTISWTALLCQPTLLAVHFRADCTQR